MNMQTIIKVQILTFSKSDLNELRCFLFYVGVDHVLPFEQSTFVPESRQLLILLFVEVPSNHKAHRN